VSWVAGEPDVTLPEVSQDRDKDVCTAPSQEEPPTVTHDVSCHRSSRMILISVPTSIPQPHVAARTLSDP
jgi:hypothetical protein